MAPVGSVHGRHPIGRRRRLSTRPRLRAASRAGRRRVAAASGGAARGDGRGVRREATDRRGRIGSGQRAIGLIIAITLAAAPPGAGAGRRRSSSLLEASRDARTRGALGDVSGRIYDEPARRNAPDRPRASVPIVLLPLHGARAAEIEAVKVDARRSMDRYRAIAAEIDSLQQRYEAAIRSAGGEDLIQRAITDEGRRVSIRSGAGGGVVPSRAARGPAPGLPPSCGPEDHGAAVLGEPRASRSRRRRLLVADHRGAGRRVHGPRADRSERRVDGRQGGPSAPARHPGALPKDR